jgi:hypothetical protein
MPFVNTVLDKPTGNASRGILSIGKNDLSLRIPFTLFISNVIRTYETLSNKMAGLATECTAQRIQCSRHLGVGAGAGMVCRQLLRCEHFEETLCHLLE